MACTVTLMPNDFYCSACVHTRIYTYTHIYSVCVYMCIYIYTHVYVYSCVCAYIDTILFKALALKVATGGEGTTGRKWLPAGPGSLTSARRNPACGRGTACCCEAFRRAHRRGPPHGAAPPGPGTSPPSGRHEHARLSARRELYSAPARGRTATRRLRSSRPTL